MWFDLRLINEQLFALTCMNALRWARLKMRGNSSWLNFLTFFHPIKHNHISFLVAQKKWCIQAHFYLYAHIPFHKNKSDLNCSHFQDLCKDWTICLVSESYLNNDGGLRAICPSQSGLVSPQNDQWGFIGKGIEVGINWA